MYKKALAALLAAVALPSLAFAQAAPTQATIPAASAVLPDADPAIWVVKDDDTTIYLFGTVHALDGKRDWFNDEVKTAYDASQEVVFEMITPEDPAKVQAAVMALAIDPNGKPLSGKLTPETARRLGEELAKVGAPATAFDRFDPWFATTALTAMTLQRMGIKPELGVEAVLTAAAKQDGKTLGEVETFEWQMNLFDGLPEPLQLAMLTSTLEQMAEVESVMATMMTSWSDGNIDTLAGVMNEAMREMPELGKIMLADRNARWAEWIDTRMDKPGAVFMAVGAGHLGGADSVQNMLVKRGIKSERVGS